MYSYYRLLLLLLLLGKGYRDMMAGPEEPFLLLYTPPKGWNQC